MWIDDNEPEPAARTVVDALLLTLAPVVTGMIAVGLLVYFFA